MPSKRAEFKFSYNEKKDIVVCPHRYDLLTVQKLPQDFDLRRMLVANVLDLVLTTWVDLGFNGVLSDLAVQRFRTYCTSNPNIRWKHPMDMRECELLAAESAQALEASMRSAGMCRIGAISQQTVKHELTLDSGQRLLLTGRLDLLYLDDMSIWDLKTTKHDRWLDRKQLVWYDFIVSHIHKRKIKRCGFLVPQIDPPVQEVPAANRDDWNLLLEELNFALATVTSGQFPDLGDADKDCYMCFAKMHCRRTKAGKPQKLVQVGNSTRVGL